MSRFVAAVNAEFTKVLSTRMWWLLGIVLLGYVAFTTAIVALGFGGQLGETEGAPGLPAAVLPPLIYSFASSIGYVFPLLVGAHAEPASPAFVSRRGCAPDLRAASTDWQPATPPSMWTVKPSIRFWALAGSVNTLSFRNRLRSRCPMRCPTTLVRSSAAA